MEYIEIKEQIKQKLPVARDFGDSENLLVTMAVNAVPMTTATARSMTLP